LSYEGVTFQHYRWGTHTASIIRHLM